MYFLCLRYINFMLDMLLQDKGSGPREVIVSWISMLLQVNEERTRLGEGGKALNPVHLACGKD